MTDVENTYMRTHKKPLEKEMINGEMQNVIHLGKDRTAFRIFGYYNTDDYFCIHRIDPNHQFYKSNYQFHSIYALFLIIILYLN